LVGLFQSSTVQADNGTWTNPVTGGLWGDPANWLNGVISDGVDASANFNTLDLTANNTVTFDAPHTLGFLNFADTTPNFNWTLTSGNILTLQTSLPNTTPTINVINQTATIQGGIAGGQGFVKAGVGTLVLNTTAGTWTGTAVINAGNLTINAAQDASASFVLTGTGTTLQTNQALATTNIINALAGSSSLTLSGIATFNGTLVGNGNVTFNNGTTTINNFGSGTGPAFVAAYGGTVTWGTNFSLRGVVSSGGGTWNSPFATIDFAGTTGSLFSRNNANYILGGLKSTGTGSSLGSPSFANTANYIVGSANTDTSFAGAMSIGTGNVTFTKVGTGTQTLLPGTSYTATGFVSFNGGTVKADYANTANAIFNAASPVTFGGGTLLMVGKSAGTTSQTMGNVMLNVGGGRLVLDPNGGVATNLTFGTLTATTNGSALNIRTVANNATVSTATAIGADGAYGGRVTFTDATGLTNWATSNSAAAPFALSGYAGYKTLAGDGSDSAATNYALTGNGTLTAADVVNSLKISTTPAASAQFLDLGANTLTVTNGGLLFNGSNDYEIKNGTLISNTATNSDLIVHQFGAGNLTISGVIANGQGNSVLTKAGTGKLTLTGANTYTGQTFLNNGITSISSNANLGDINTGAAIALDNGTLQATATFALDNSGSSSRNIILYGSGGTIDVPGANNLTVSGIISNINTSNQGPLIKTGSGTLSLSGTNTYTGATRISGGVISVATLADGGTASGIGQSVGAAPALVFDGGTLQYTGGAQSTNRTFTVTPNGGTIDASGTGPLTFSNAAPVVVDSPLAGSGARTLTLTGSATDNVFAGQVVNGTGGVTSLQKSGAGSWTLSHPNHTYTGNTTVTAGTLALSAPNTNNIRTSPLISIGAGATLDTRQLSGGGITLASQQTLTGSGAVNGGVTAAAGSIITPGSNGVGVLTTSALTLAPGSIYNYEFNATPANDLLNVITPNALTLNGGGFNLFAEGTQNKWTTAGKYKLIQYAGSLGGTGIGALTSSSIVNPQAGLSYSFDTTSFPGFITLNITGVASLVSKWAVNADGNWSTASNWTTNPIIPQIAGDTANFTTVLSAPRTVTLDGSKTVGAMEFNSSPNGYTIALGSGVLTLDNLNVSATISDTAGNHTIAVPLALKSNVLISVANASDTLNVSGSISNTSANFTLAKTGPGTLILSGNNTYGPATSGAIGTTFSGGTLQVGSNSAIGAGDLSINGSSTLTAGAPNLTLANNISLAGSSATFNTQANTMLLTGVLSDSQIASGGFIKTGAGLLKLTGNNTFSGATTVSAGTLQIGDAGASGALVGPIVNNAALVFNHTDSPVVTNLISGTGSLTQAGAGNITITAANTFSGDTVVAAGTLTIDNPLALQNSTLNYNNQGGTLSFGNETAASFGALKGAQNLVLTNSDVTPAAVALDIGNNGQSTTYSGAMSGLGSVRKSHTGTLTLSGANTYAGNTDVNAGVLTIVTGGSINGAAAGASGGLLQVNGGAVTSSALSTIIGQGFVLNSGTVAYNAGVQSDINDGTLIRVNGGLFSATSLVLRRTVNFNTTAPTPTGIAGATTTGFYITGGAASLGTLSIGTLNSSASVRVDGGDVTVTGRVLLGTETNTRYNVLHVNGGSFTSTDPVDGIVISQANGATGNNAEVLLTAGTTTAEKIAFGAASDGAGGTGFLILNGAAANLYVGSGGITQPNNAGLASTIYLTAGTLGAKADWQSPLPMQLSGTSYTIKAADAANAPHNINFDGQISGAGALVKTGAGITTLSAANTYTGATTVTGGTLSVTGSIAQSVGVTVSDPNAAFEAASSQVVKSLTVTAGQARVTTPAAAVQKSVLVVGDGTATTSQLTLTGGKLDLVSNGLIVDYSATDAAGDAAAASSVRSQLIAGYGANHDWKGATGITSSTAAAASLGAVGYALAGDVLPFADGVSDTFLGTTVDKSTVIARYTLSGDINLDGAVDFLDLARLAQSYNVTDGTRQWSTGDLNYDGNTDFLDLAKLAQNYNTALPSAPIPGASPDFNADLARAFASVPEPSATTLALIATCGLAAQRRRRRSSPGV
jgi:autotransporter-associated beta strand protein